MNLMVAAALCSQWAYRCGSAALKGSLMARLTSFMITAPILIIGATSDAQSPSCSCGPGTEFVARADGDASPLEWAFSAVQKDPGSPDRARLICYKKLVENKSGDEVRDIYWRVAGYKRAFIPPSAARPSCVDYRGEIKSAPENGPLNFGTSSQAYDTTVWPPVSGWKTDAASSEAGSFLPLKAEFLFDIRGEKGGHSESHIVITSSAFYDTKEKTGTVIFDINNEGNSDVGMFMNIPIPQKPFYPKGMVSPYVSIAHKQTTFKIPVDEPPRFKPTTIIFYDTDGQIAALETAGLYVPASGKPLYSDYELWKER